MTTQHSGPDKDDPKTLEPNKLDPLIKEAISSVKPPEWLKDSILENGPKARPTLLRFPIAKIAIAAVFVAGFFFAFMILKMKNNDELRDSSDLRAAAASYIADAGFLLDLNESSLDTIYDWLEARQAPNISRLPSSLTDLQPIGCKELTWRGESITLVCFHLDDGQIVHLFIGNQTAQTNELLASISDIQRTQGLETGGWVSEQQVYLLTGSEPSVSIQPYY